MGKKIERYATFIPMPELDTEEKRMNPFPIFKQLRQTTPVRYDEGRNCWDVFRYEDVQRILKDPAVFSSKRGLDGGQIESILTMDPPRHSQMRAIVNKAFTPKVVSDLGLHINSIATDLLDTVQESGKMDMVHDFAVPLPVFVITELLGVPPEDRQLFKTWSDVLVKGVNQNTNEAFNLIMAEKMQVTKELGAYFSKIIEQRRKAPKEDLISLLLSAEIEGQKLNDQELIGFSVVLLAAGNETTTNLITNAVRYLTEEPKLQKLLHENTELVPGFIEEVLRFYPPIQAIARVAKKDIEIGGKKIKSGDQVVNWVGSANRDELKFTDPDSFVIDRHPNPHMAFGFGIHFCLGAPLARLEGKIAIGTIVERLEQIQTVQDFQLTSIQSPFVYGVEQFPVTYSIVKK